MAIQKKSTYVYRAACSRCKWRGREGSKEQATKEQKSHDAKHKASHNAAMKNATPISQDEVDNYRSEFR